MGQLTGKTALVTGGGRGVGRSIALALARAGADVAVTSRSKAELEEVAAEIEKLRGLSPEEMESSPMARWKAGSPAVSGQFFGPTLSDDGTAATQAPVDTPLEQRRAWLERPVDGPYPGR